LPQGVLTPLAALFSNESSGREAADMSPLPADCALCVAGTGDKFLKRPRIHNSILNEGTL
jgi:hypothetical protein